MKVKVPILTAIAVVVILILLILFTLRILFSALVIAWYCLLVLTPIVILLFWKRIWKYLTEPKQLK